MKTNQIKKLLASGFSELWRDPKNGNLYTRDAAWNVFKARQNENKISAKAESGRVEEQAEAVLRRISEYRSGYSCGYSDAKNGTRMRDKDAAEAFFRSEIEGGTIPDVFVDEQPLGNCETPHFLGEPTLDRKALTQYPHHELPQGLCKNWVDSHSQPSVKEKL